MIIKSLDTRTTTNNLQKVGYDAEKQMAFYLKRAFQAERKILVINDLRLVKGNDAAQIDHLIIHSYGFIIVESKSVTSKVTVNEHGEWVRHYQNDSVGIPSPVKQAERQAEFLKHFLNIHSEHLLRKKKWFKATIADFNFDVLVAISDSGIIERSDHSQSNSVFKADLISDQISQLIEKYRKVNRNLLNPYCHFHFADSSMVKVVKYLVHSHTPLPTKTVAKSDIQNKHSHAYQCNKCQSNNVQIVYGRYGYYFKCDDCNGNSSIALSCQHYSCKPRIKKKKETFYKVCSSCNTSELFFRNRQIA